MPCRLEKVITPEFTKSGTNIWLDVCHNEQGLQSVLNTFATDFDKKNKPLTIVCGFSKSKDITKMLGMIS
jgi:folylpolyglutamate synthase/dihydropteroate synthase